MRFRIPGKTPDSKKLVGNRFELSKITKAYDTLGNASKERALEVVLKNAKGKRRSFDRRLHNG